MAPIDRSCSNATLHPNMYIKKFNIFRLSLCITDVTPPRLQSWQLRALRHRDLFSRELQNKSVLVLPVLFIRDFLYNIFLLGISYIIGSNDFRRVRRSGPGGICWAAVGENDRPGMGSWERGMIHPSLESWDPQLSIDPTSVLHSTY